MKNFAIGLFIFVWIFAGITIPLYLINNNESFISRRQQNAIKAQRMEEYEIARNQLAIEVDNYISSIAPKANIDAFLMVDLCWQYGVDIRFVLAQGHIESHFATKGTAARTLSIFNVGAYDGHSATRQKRNGFGYSDPNDSIEPYLQLITNEYMVNGKTEIDLMQNYVNRLGMRYASNPRYERMLRSVYKRISNKPAFSIAYENYLESQNNLALC
jgi:flagellum-specific peptidoglycan hydrolase FlgJ